MKRLGKRNEEVQATFPFLNVGISPILTPNKEANSQETLNSHQQKILNDTALHYIRCISYLNYNEKKIIINSLRYFELHLINPDMISITCTIN